MKELKTYEHDGMALRALMDEKWMPYFALKDIFKVIQPRNTDRALKCLKEYQTKEIITDGFRRELIVGEAGFYLLSIRSKSRYAKPLRKWVAHEVVPALCQIRRQEEVFYRASKRYPKYFLHLCRNLVSSSEQRILTERLKKTLDETRPGLQESERIRQNLLRNIVQKLEGHLIQEDLFRVAVQFELGCAFEELKKESQRYHTLKKEVS